MITFLIAGLSALVLGQATKATVRLTTTVRLFNYIDFTPELADMTSDEYISLEQQNKNYLYAPMIDVLEKENMTLEVFNLRFSEEYTTMTCILKNSTNINGTETNANFGKTKVLMKLEYYRYLTDSESNTYVENFAEQLEDELDSKIKNKVQDVADADLYWTKCGAHGSRSHSIMTESNCMGCGIGLDSVDTENSDCKTRVNILQYILSYSLILKVLQM